MRTNSRKWAHALTMVVLTAAVSLSGRVEAQQTGLFPLAPIRRQRVPCDQEDPTYKIYKHQYFGYHPTCWRTFPSGWGCPSAEAPNQQQSFDKLPPGNVPRDEDAGMPPDDDRGDQQPRRPMGIPDLPRPQDPFTDPPAGAVPGANPLPRGNSPARPAPGTGDESVQGRQSPGSGPVPITTRSQTRGATTTTDDGTPALSVPVRTPAQGSASRSGRGGTDGETLAADDEVPPGGLADSDIVRSDTGSVDDSQAEVPAASNSSSSSDTAAAAPAQTARPRRRFFANLFSGFGSNANKP